MFQAYVSAGPGCSVLLHIKNGCTFISDLYSDKISHAISEFRFSENDKIVSTEIQYKGTSYKKGEFLILNNDESITFGELLIILIKDNTAVYFVMNAHKSDHLPKYHLYSVTQQSTGIQCANINDLLEFYPLSSYIVDGHRVIPLKHSVLSH